MSINNKILVKNFSILHNVMEYKHDMSKTDKWWGNKAKELNNVIKDLDNGKVKNLNQNKQNKLKDILKDIDKRFKKWHQKFKYSKPLNPFLKKEKRIRKLIKKMLTFIEDGRGKRKNLFKIDKKYGYLRMNNKLKNIFNKSIYLNFINNNSNNHSDNNSNFSKKLIKILDKKFNELNIDGVNYFTEILMKCNIDEIINELKAINVEINGKLEEKIRKMRNYHSINIKLKMYNFIIFYNNFLDNLNNIYPELKLKKINIYMIERLILDILPPKTFDKPVILEDIYRFVKLVKKTNQNKEEFPNIIWMFGETHRKGPLGTRCKSNYDVVSYNDLYHYLLHEHELFSDEISDFFIEVPNIDLSKDNSNVFELLYPVDNRKKINTLRHIYKYCYIKNRSKCQYKKTRFHWTETDNNEERKRIEKKEGWSNEKIKKTEWLDLIPGPLRTPNEQYKYHEQHPEILENIKNNNNLKKIIFNNLIIIKQGEKFGITNWKKILEDILDEVVKNYFNNNTRFNQFKTIGIWNGTDETTIKIKMNIIWYIFRYKVDVYTFLRMFRAKNQPLKIKNVIYHSGAFHTNNLVMLIEKTGKYEIKKDFVSNDSEKPCLNFDFKKDFL